MLLGVVPVLIWGWNSSGMTMADPGGGRGVFDVPRASYVWGVVCLLLPHGLAQVDCGKDDAASAAVVAGRAPALSFRLGHQLPGWTAITHGSHINTTRCVLSIYSNTSLDPGSPTAFPPIFCPSRTASTILTVRSAYTTMAGWFASTNSALDEQVDRATASSL